MLANVNAPRRGGVRRGARQIAREIDMAKQPKANNNRLGIVAGRVEDAPDPVDIHVGRRLRLRRGMLGMSQTQLAQQVGLTFQAIQKYERGENRVSASRLHQFARILDVEIAYFFDDLPAGSARVGRGEPDWLGLPKNEAFELLRAYSALSDQRLRRSFLRLLKDSAAATGAEEMEPRRRSRAGS
jgi:transcriptional regulator with XRE-family HTH domain